MTPLALHVTGLAVALTPRITAAWKLRLPRAVVLGPEPSARSRWVAATVAKPRFVSGRGIVVGVLTAAATKGQLVFLAILAAATAAPCWRPPGLIVPGVALAVVPLVASLARDTPAAIGPRPYGAQASH